MPDLPAMLRIAMQAGRSNGRKKQMFYTYVLKLNNQDLYIGWTVDLVNRVKLHNTGKVDATKSYLPAKLVYYEACLSREKAINREKQLKSGFGRAYLKRRLY